MKPRYYTDYLNEQKDRMRKEETGVMFPATNIGANLNILKKFGFHEDNYEYALNK